MSTKCDKTGKTRFNTFDGANARMKFIQRHPNKQCPVRVYPCDFCGGFHLTKSYGYEKVKEVKMKSEFAKFIQKPDDI